MSARDDILASVRAGLGERTRDPAAIAAEAAALLADPDAIRPRLVAGSLVESFVAKAGALGTTFGRAAGMAGIPAAVAAYLAGHGLGPAAVQETPDLAGLDWADRRATLAADEPAAVGMARWGVAESGSVVIQSGADSPILLAFLPLHHIVVLRVENILAHLEDYAAVLEREGGGARNTVLITGPSGTTDIEGSYVRGAHGPGFVHVILVEAEG